MNMATTAAKKKKGAAPTPATASSGAGKSNTLQVVDDGKKPMEQIRAELAAEGILANATTMASFSRATMGELGLTESVKALRSTADTIYGGNLKPAEEMLVAQATSLNAIFCELARRSGLNMGEHLDAADRYMRLALKAQAQCRATLEALAEIKNPRPVAFVKQANIAHGPQQVNNSAAPSTRTGARARGRNGDPAKRTIGGPAWQLPGRRSGEHCRLSASGPGSRGRGAPARARLRARPPPPATPSKADFAPRCGSSPAW